MFTRNRITPVMGLLLVALWAVPQGASGFKPQPFEARFALEARGFTVGESVWSLKCGKDGCVYEARTEAVGIAAMFSDKQVVERSEWKRIGDSLKPARYHYERSSRPDKTRSVEFDWEGGVARNTRRGETSRMAIPEGTLDRLGYMLVVMEDLRAGKRDLRYHIADGKNRTKTYEFKVVGEEWLNTALGKIRALKLIRERDDDDRETTIWTAPSLDFMPVRMEHRERDEDELTIVIRSLSRHTMAGEQSSGEVESPGRLGPSR